MTVRTRPSARCRRLLLEISRYFDGDLTPARQRMVERHVRACACCATLAARLRRTVAACRAEGARRPPRDMILRAQARIRALIAHGQRDVPAAQRHHRTGKATARQSATAKR
jgi:anti-sigma factor RsiW